MKKNRITTCGGDYYYFDQESDEYNDIISPYEIKLYFTHAIANTSTGIQSSSGRPRREAAKKGEKKRRKLLWKDKKLGRYLRELMETSTGYYKVTKRLKARQEYLGR